MGLKLYDLVGKDGLRYSPFGWRVRMSLLHKGLEAEWEPVNFTDKDKIAFSGQKRVPVLVDGESVVSDSWAIVNYLDEAYPDSPSLLGGAAAIPMMRAWNHYVDTIVHPAMAKIIVGDVFDNVDPIDMDYFRETREQIFGKTMEQCKEDGERHLPGLVPALLPARRQLEEYAFIGGDSPNFGDFCLFGPLQWARCSSPRKLLPEDHAVEQWRQRMLDLFDGHARQAPCCEAA
ncbi:MAG: glutathione S-transferase N-terminal domain-containing protein [Alphaproteobacteria bacterium]|nr:glutathione S-transferase N-terminal domain-containing protein [Alphaproteobacteria bacterium]